MAYQGGNGLTGKKAHAAGCLFFCPQVQDASSWHQQSSWFTHCIRKGVFEPLQRHAGSCTGLHGKLPQAISVLSIAAQPVAVHPRAAATAAAAHLTHVQLLSSVGWDSAPYSYSLSHSAIRPQPWGTTGFLCLPLTVHPQRSRSESQIVSI